MSVGGANAAVVSSIVSVARRVLLGGGSTAAQQELSVVLLEWVRQPELRELSLQMAKAWVESEPVSECARSTLMELLVSAGRIDEGVEFDSGAAPRGLMPRNDADSRIAELFEVELRRQVDAGAIDHLIHHEESARVRMAVSEDDSDDL